jgi:hypothetical protein
MLRLKTKVPTPHLSGTITHGFSTLLYFPYLRQIALATLVEQRINRSVLRPTSKKKSLCNFSRTTEPL